MGGGYLANVPNVSDGDRERYLSFRLIRGASRLRRERKRTQLISTCTPESCEVPHQNRLDLAPNASFPMWLGSTANTRLSIHFGGTGVGMKSVGLIAAIHSVIVPHATRTLFCSTVINLRRWWASE
ncbi:hypothetical protein PAXRUDRAFT_739038 [Paxillus rubicundulus Ve08.2h10]|uniref:Uncharacterized protein n=1 Tax=Paxillus rubicundulus Ve08.2h10 TaxID=930991 RepID=A0A0D0DQW5_9AGAM|nr:hypothetical protein PAXRUDRAFT_739038 [Paxillus rubicundulus Ve08.2h10]